MIPNDYQSLFVIMVIIILFTVIYKEWLKPSFSFFGACIIFLFSGILTPNEVIGGLANDKIISILLLIIISGTFRRNFDVESLFSYIFKSGISYKSFLMRIMLPVAGLSTIVNNSPVVALLTPYVHNWGIKNGIAPSKLLIPLSFATILGGMITVIGTSTTLLINGFLEERSLRSIDPIHLLILGGSVAIIGILYLLIFAPMLLPDHKDVMTDFQSNNREYFVECGIKDESHLLGKSVLEAGLMDVEGIFLIEIDRNNQIFQAKKTDILQPKDRLIFVGNTKDILLLESQFEGIYPCELNKNHIESEKVHIVEAVIGANSSFVGQTAKSSKFHAMTDGVIVAIHRNGERINKKISEVTLVPGDLILLFAGDNFNEKIDPYRDIILIKKQKNKNSSINQRRKKTALLIAAITALIYCTFMPFDLLAVLMIIVGVFFVFKMINIKDFKKETDFNLMAILIFSLAIGLAIEKTNTGNMIASYIILLLKPYGVASIIIGLMVFSAVLTSLIGNVGTISITFPIAIGLVETLPFPIAPFMLAIAFGASATFLTPVSYQTNLIIYGPGGYTFKDFFKIGLPMAIIYLGVSFTGIYLLFLT